MPIVPAESEWDRTCPEAFISRWRGADKSQLFNMLGWQEGAQLGTPEALELINAPRPTWLWDRPTQRLLDVRQAHPVVAGMLYRAHSGKEYHRDGGEEYLRAGMGFWISSVSNGLNIHVPPGFKVTAQERQAFRGYSFQMWT
jgi:hypothetical protein